MEKGKGNERKSAFGLRRLWMQEIREALIDFSKMEEESWPELLAAQEQVLSADFAVASLDNSDSIVCLRKMVWETHWCRARLRVR